MFEPLLDSLTKKGFYVSDNGMFLVYAYDARKGDLPEQGLEDLLGKEFIESISPTPKTILILSKFIAVDFVSVLEDGTRPMIHCGLPCGKKFAFREKLVADQRQFFELLLDLGCNLHPSPLTFMMLKIYFHEYAKSSKKIIRSPNYGWSHDNRHFALEHGYVGRKHYACGDQYLQPLNKVVPSALKLWQDDIAHYALQNARGAIALGCAFAAPLMKHLSHEAGFGVHFFGESSSGKTILSKIANTVFARPNDILLRTWNTTRSGVDQMLKISNDLPLILDDMADQTLDPSAIYQTIYGIASGRSRSRCNTSGELQEIHNWRTILMSSGEKDLQTFLHGANISVQAGQLVRVLNIGCHDEHRAFDFIPPQFSNSSQFAEYLQDRLKNEKYYGMAGQAFVESLINTPMTQIKDQFLEFLEMFYNWIGREQTSQAMRALRHFGMMFFSLDLAYKFWITGYPVERILNPALRLVINQFIQSLGEKSFEKHSALTTFVHKVQANEYKRFLYYTENETNQQIWGWRDDDYIYIYMSALRQEIAKGVSLRPLLDNLKEREILVTRNADEATIVARFGGKPNRVYKIDKEKLYSATRE